MKGWTKVGGEWHRDDGVYRLWIQERPLHEPPMWQLAVRAGHWSPEEGRDLGNTRAGNGELWLGGAGMKGEAMDRMRKRDAEGPAAKRGTPPKIISGSNEPDPDKRLVDWQKEADDGGPDE